MKTTIELKIGGKSVGGVISRYVKSIGYRETVDGEADTLELTMHDAEGLFIDEWFPPRGTSVELTLLDEEFNRMDLGSFVIDEVENTSDGGGSQCKMKANSIPPGSAAKNVEKSRSWEDVTLKRIALDVASDAGLNLRFRASDDPHYDRLEQSEQSDLSFLYKLCRDAGLSMKVNDRQLVIFDYELYEAKSAVGTLSRHLIKRFTGKKTLNEVYTSCEVKYKDGGKGELIASATGASGVLSGLMGGGGRTLKVNKRVSSAGDAQRLAKKKLREQNRKETTVQVTAVGNFVYRCGATLNIEGYGVYDGKYLIDKADHKVGRGGYEVSMELTKCQ